MISKKRKVFTKIESDFSAEIRNSKVFSAHNQVISKKKKKKKKRSSPISRLIFRPISQIQSFEGELFSNGGTIFHFSQKIGLKSKKKHAILHTSQANGGFEPPRPPPWLRYWLEPPVRFCEYPQSRKALKLAKPQTRKAAKSPKPHGKEHVILLSLIRFEVSTEGL